MKDYGDKVEMDIGSGYVSRSLMTQITHTARTTDNTKSTVLIRKHIQQVLKRKQVKHIHYLFSQQ